MQAFSLAAAGDASFHGVRNIASDYSTMGLLRV